MSSPDQEPVFQLFAFEDGKTPEERPAYLYASSVDFLYYVCKKANVNPADHLTEDELVYAVTNAELQQELKARKAVLGHEVLELVRDQDWGHPIDVSRIIIPTSFPPEGAYFKSPNGTPEYVIKKDVTPTEIVRLVQEDI